MQIQDFPTTAILKASAASLDGLVQERARGIAKFISDSHSYLLGDGQGDYEAAIRALRVIADQVVALSIDVGRSNREIQSWVPSGPTVN